MRIGGTGGRRHDRHAAWRSACGCHEKVPTRSWFPRVGDGESSLRFFTTEGGRGTEGVICGRFVRRLSQGDVRVIVGGYLAAAGWELEGVTGNGVTGSVVAGCMAGDVRHGAGAR